uniref:hypothetical protein n=1 Tax=Cryobacterium sp. TaxID=1926290 RepID=UPI0015996CEF|nr:hypothetical protein [Cryobacterium sp.]QJS06367.1 hypothetical protein [Cryobacterium sp.]
MPIKKRTPVDPAEREAAIEAFGKAANYEPAAEPEPPVPAKAPQKTVGAARRASPARAKAKTTGEKAEIKPMLMRFDADQHALLQEVAELEGRSMHNMALTALIPALEAIRDEHRK